MARSSLASLTLALGTVALGGCAGAVAADAVVAPIALDRHPELLVGLQLPESSRSTPTPDQIPVNGTWRVSSTLAGTRTWETDLPVRLRTLFFSSPPDDLAVYDSGGDRSLSYVNTTSQGNRARTWEFGPTSLRVRRPATEGPPEPGEIVVRYSRATARERSLNLTESGLSEREFLFRSLQVRDATRHGLLVPAPGVATFKVDVPEGAVLDWSAAILPPEAADGPPSDGATLSVVVRVDGEETPLTAQSLKLESFDQKRVDLGPWAGKSVELTFRTDPAGEAHGDYAFIVEPTVLVPQARPPRVVLVFIDTLRADHLSLYGYPRKTTPALDAWAVDAAVFEQARSIAPWTLPSARTMVTGVPPERWEQVETLQHRFARAGWATAFFAGNTYLSSNFDIDRDWGLHRCINWPRAEVEIDRALAWLDEHEDQPAFLQVHLMDQHLPYREPLRWRFRFAGLRPDTLTSNYFKRSEVQRVASKLGEKGRQHLRDRYDNNLGYVDSQLARLLARLDITARDTVLILADHGEEFWDHGGFEHGHALWDELVRVPFVVAGPGVSAGRFTEPVSLLDVAPTLAKAAGLSLDGFVGEPVQGVADRSRAAAFGERPQAFGRPLYGTSQWGSLHGADKLIVKDGEESLYNLGADPKEKDPSTPGSAERERMRAHMETALGNPVAMAWRITPSTRGASSAMAATLEVPGGVLAAWGAEDPTEQNGVIVESTGTQVTMKWKSGNSRVMEVFVVPREGAVAALATASLAVTSARRDITIPAMWPAEEPLPEPDGTGATLLTARDGPRNVTLSYALAPLPYADSAGLHGFDSEVAGELKALGYIEE